jgi:hypothetical protein
MATFSPKTNTQLKPVTPEVTQEAVPHSQEVEASIPEVIVKEPETVTPEPIPVVPVEQPIVVPPTQALKQMAQAVMGFTTTLEEDFAKVSKSTNPLVSIIIGNLKQYMFTMKPRQTVSDGVGANMQEMLWRTFFMIIEKGEEDFKDLFSLLLRCFHEYEEGVFNERFVFRFTDNINLPKNQRLGFMRILNLLKLTANPLNRKAGLKQQDIHKTLGDVFTDKGYQNVINFFNL